MHGGKLGQGMVTAVVLVLVLASASRAQAAEWKVPEDTGCETIQDCIKHASDGDVILVKSGTYVENIDFVGRAVRVSSMEPYGAVIDGGEGLPTVTFASGEGTGSILEGFEIRNGGPGSQLRSIGVLCENASPVMRYNRITGEGHEKRTAIRVDGSGGRASPLIQGNDIWDNQAGMGISGTVHGVHALHASPVIMDNVFCELKVVDPVARVYGVRIEEPTGPVKIVGNVITSCLTSANNEMGFPRFAGIEVLGWDATPPMLEIKQNVIESNGSYGWSGLHPSTAYLDGIFVSLRGPEPNRTEIWGNAVSRNFAGFPYTPGEFLGIVSIGQHHLDVRNNVVNLNFAMEHASGLVANNCSGEAFLLHNTIVHNFSYTWWYGWGMIYLSHMEGKTVLMNNIVGPEGTGIAVYRCPLIEADWNDVWGSKPYHGIEPGPHDLHLDPLFQSSGDFHLSGDSPCIDRGLNVGVSRDLDGHPRPQGAAPDIGADEVPIAFEMIGPGAGKPEGRKASPVLR